ncbi:MAG TPA: hypothetical protein VFB70_04750 [Pyrinomonadaceae bacterium]|nr:hypothetical protein [Pyrinomonadaceae bacterium]
MRSHICFRLDAANTQDGYRPSEYSEVIGLEIIVEISFRFPFTNEQGRVLVGHVKVAIERATAFGLLHWIE